MQERKRNEKKRKMSLLRVTALVIPMVLLLLLSQTALAQNTYVITDGDQVKVYSTYATNAEEVLVQAGVALDKDDTYTTQPGDGVSEITIQRSQTITVNNCGEILTATSYGETLEDLLNRLGVPAHGEYSVSLPMDTLTYDGMEVTVRHTVEGEEVYTGEIPFEITYCNDPSLPAGQEQILVPGVVGQMQIRAHVVYVNAAESDRTVLEETVIAQPVNQVVLVGTGTEETIDPDAPAIGDGVIVTADGEILTYTKSAQFLTTAYNHTDAGCDMTTATGTTVRLGTVAVDPTVVPYGTRMFIVSNDGKYVYGIATAEDCGGGVKGNHIDLYYPTTDECWQYGRRNATVYFLG